MIHEDNAPTRLEIATLLSNEQTKPAFKSKKDKKDKRDFLKNSAKSYLSDKGIKGADLEAILSDIDSYPEMEPDEAPFSRQV